MRTLAILYKLIILVPKAIVRVIQSERHFNLALKELNKIGRGPTKEEIRKEKLRMKLRMRDLNKWPGEV